MMMIQAYYYYIFFLLIYKMSDKMHELINHVKELIQDGNIATEQCIRGINNEIDSKENEIRQLFSQNIDSVINYYIKFHHTSSKHKKIEESCEEFNKNIQKNQKLNSYDEQQIVKYQANLKQIKLIKQKLNEFKGYIKMAKKASLNIKQQKYSIAIKVINQFKNNPPKVNTPLNNILPILEKKVEDHLRILLHSFWIQNSKKMLEIGQNCYNKIESNYQEKVNIYQIFFGGNFRKSTANNGSTFRYTVLAKQNQSKIFKESNDCQQFFSKIMVRINVQMSILKKVKMMQTQLKNQGMFNDMLINSMRDYLIVIQESICEKHTDFIRCLSVLIGFLLMRRQVCAFFDIKYEEKVFMNLVYALISKEIKNLAQHIKTREIIIDIKESLSVFHKLMTILKLNEDNEKYNVIVGQLLRHFNARNLELYQIQSHKEIENDNLAHFQIQNSEKQILIRQIFDMTNEAKFKFTGYVVFIMDYFLKSYEDAIKLLQQSDINQSAIFLAINELYQKILIFYGKQLLDKNNHFEIVQGQLNVIYINKVYKYIVRQMQFFHGIASNTIKLQERFQQLMVKLTGNILEVIRQKLEVLMQGYDNFQQMNQLNSQNNDFMEWALEFINQILTFMKDIDCPNYDSIILETMREMCELYWQYLKKLKEINLIIIYNLDLDLSFIYKFCSKHFKDNMNLLQKFKSLREFYSLMLVNNIQDLLEPQKRNISYSSLNMQIVMFLLKKYNQVKIPENKIRDLKKKDVQALVKKYMSNAK